MPLKGQDIGELLEPYMGSAGLSPQDRQRISGQLESYLELLLKWNARLNLTAIRTPEEIVRRHFGESLFAGFELFPDSSGAGESLLDFGSGAGFPGIPIQILRPELSVTLAESRQKKAAFLREVVRNLGLSTEIWAGRVEQMPLERRFDVVALRAVDEMEEAVGLAAERALGRIAILGVQSSGYSALSGSWEKARSIGLPGSTERVLAIYRRTAG
jgi:16S rRNA (guanine527-N7)-methyltransferase